MIENTVTTTGPLVGPLIIALVIGVCLYAVCSDVIRDSDRISCTCDPDDDENRTPCMYCCITGENDDGSSSDDVDDMKTKMA